MSCPKCISHRLIAIKVNIGDNRVTMRSCSSCGTRWWESDGNPVALPQVLELAAGHR